MTPTNVIPAPSPDVGSITASETPASPPRRPLRREGARYFLSSAEQAVEDAMNRSSPAPDPVLGKRAHQADEQDGNDTEEDTSSTAPRQPATPSIANVAAASLRYASKKKLRAEHRDEVETFLLVSTSLVYLGSL